MIPVRLPVLLRFVANGILLADFGNFDITRAGVSDSIWWNTARDPLPAGALNKTGYVYERFYRAVSHATLNNRYALLLHALDSDGKILNSSGLAGDGSIWNLSNAPVWLPDATYSGDVQIAKPTAGLQLEVVQYTDTGATVTGTLPRPLSIIF